MTTNTNVDIGSEKLTKVGTLISGTWNASTWEVPYGGSGASSFTTYTPVCAGTTSTNPFQSTPSIGTLGQVLTSNGAAVLPSFQTIASGPSLISTQTAATSATIDFTDLTGYTHYRIYIRNIQPSTDGSNLNVRITTDGGATWKSGASDYQRQRMNISNTTNVGEGSTGTNAIGIGDSASNAANETGSFIIDIVDPAQVLGYCTIFSDSMFVNSSSNMAIIQTGGQYKTESAINGIRFYYNSGNIASGYFSLYGIK